MGLSLIGSDEYAIAALFKTYPFKKKLGTAK